MQGYIFSKNITFFPFSQNDIGTVKIHPFSPFFFLFPFFIIIYPPPKKTFKINNIYNKNGNLYSCNLFLAKFYNSSTVNIIASPMRALKL